MWWEIGEKIIDGYPYYPMIDLMIAAITILVFALIGMWIVYKEEKAKNNKLLDILDYYYHNEDLNK